MESKKNGLTVGELTMAIGALIIAALIWASIAKKEEAQKSFNIINHDAISFKSLTTM